MAIKRSRSDGAAGKAKPRSDAYVGMLTISLVALITTAALLGYDYSLYSSEKPKVPQAPGPLASGGQEKPETPVRPGGGGRPQRQPPGKQVPPPSTEKASEGS